MDAYPTVMDITANITSSLESGKPMLLSFSAREVSDGTLFKTIEDYDPQSKGLIHQLEKPGVSEIKYGVAGFDILIIESMHQPVNHQTKYYQGDPVLNHLTPWERPPIKNVFCIYGIDSKLRVSTVKADQVILFLEILTIPAEMERYPRTLSHGATVQELAWAKSEHNKGSTGRT